MHPFLVIGVFVVVFLEIRLFHDGNGRLSRILTTMQLLQAGYAYVAARFAAGDVPRVTRSARCLPNRRGPPPRPGLNPRPGTVTRRSSGLS